MRGILTYHSIDPSGSPISVSPDELARHVEWLASGEVAVLPLTDVARADVVGDAVALTFDDGFANLAQAWPLLREHGLPATVFVVPERVGRDNAWEGEGPAVRGVPVLPLLAWDELGRLAEDGLAIGGHGLRHVPLPGLSAAELEDEVQGSRARIERELGIVPETFAYPYGLHDSAAVTEVRRAYRLACTTELRALEPSDHPLLLPRLDAYYLRAPGRLESWGRPAFRAYVAFRAGARGLRGFARGLGGKRPV